MGSYVVISERRY
ncbi:hypothetical protein LINPERPRIM_LOCUS427 [Linum perenne]